MKPACKDCQFWEKASEHAGYCCRYPPTALATIDGYSCRFPYVDEKDWCGEFSPRQPDAIAETDPRPNRP